MKEQKPSRHRRLPVGTEPMGIVISRGPETELPPRFSAYMYAPVPEETPGEPALATA